MNRLEGSTYHYTTFSALKGIVQSRALYATNLRSVNDISELRHAFELTIRHLLIWKGELPRFGEKIQTIGPYLEEALAKFRNLLEQPPQVHAASFSTHRDDLSQWRGYANRPDGVCIEFGIAGLQKTARGQPFELVPVDYARPDGMGFNWPSGSMFEELSPWREAAKTADRAMDSDRRIAVLAAKLKDDAFKSEGEVRLVHSVDGSLEPFEFNGRQRVKFDLRDNSFGPLAICGVMVGPSPDASSDVPQVEAFLRDNGIGIQVSKSTIPYRHVPSPAS